MRFALTTDQAELAEAVQQVLVDQCPPSLVRAAWDAAPRPAATTAELWRHLVDLGLPAILVPEADGGFGLGEVELVAAMEQVGRHAVPLPVLDTMVLAPLLGRHAPTEAAEVLDGSRRVAWAPEGDLAAWADAAGLVVVGGAPGTTVGRGVPTGAEAPSTVDRARPLTPVALESPSALWPLSDDEQQRLWLRAALGAAAELVGLAATMVTMTVDYVAQRRQFGAPIGSFQAVKHHLANAEIAVELTRPLVHQAAWQLAEGDATLAAAQVAMAKTRAGRAAVQVARLCIQCHGGMGYTTEYDLHLFAKRAWALNAAYGSASSHLQSVTSALPLLLQDA